MDNLTHSLVGVMLSRAGLNRLTPRAGWIMVLAANIPDVDVITGAAGAEVYFQYHRWATHAIAAIPVMAILPVLIVALVFRTKLSWIGAWIASVVGVSSHLLLDYTNAYGIRLWLPFSDAWTALDITSVIDIWIWTVLLIALAAPAVSKLVSSEIGGARTSGRGWAIFALIAIIVYDSGRFFLHRQAVEVQQSRVYNGSSPRTATAFPGHVNPMLWTGVVETDVAFVVQDVNLLTGFDPSTNGTLYKPESSPAMEAARRTPLFRTFLGFSRAPLFRVLPAEDLETGPRVEAVDLRFGFRVIAFLRADGGVERTSFAFR